MLKLEVTRQLTLSLWRQKEAQFEVGCYVWCAREPARSLPQRRPIAAHTLEIDTKLSSLAQASPGLNLAGFFESLLSSVS